MAKRRWITGGALAVALLVGACGGSGESEGGTKVEADKPIDAVVASSARMAEEKSSKVSFFMKMDAQGQAFEVTGDGAFDFMSANGTFIMTMPEIQGQKIGQIEVVMLDGIMYQKFPPELAAGLGGKPWVKIDLNKAMGANVSQLAQAQSSNPTQMAAMTLGAETVEEVGTEDVRGTSTTHYKVTVNLKKAVAEAEGEMKKVAEQAAQLYKAETMPFELWLDDEGLPRRMKFLMDFSQMNLPKEAAGMSGSMDITMDMFEYGTPVSVTAPPADQVTDMETLTGGGGGA